MEKRSMLVKAAVAGLMGAAVAATPSFAKDAKAKKKTKDENVKCYGVNSCAGHGKDKNSCKGLGWLPMPKDSCLNIEGGSLEPKAAAPMEKK